MTTFGWIIVGLAAVMLWSWMRGRRSPEQLAAIRNALAEGATLLDVRSVAEFGSGHLSGATNLPLSELDGSSAKVPGKKPIVVYCQSGMRSARAASLLRANGHAAVLDLGPIRNGAAIGK